jgi:hypothetical protein
LAVPGSFLKELELEESAMGSAIYKVIPFEDGWGVAHDGETVGPYKTREAAFEATAAAASLALREGHAIEITAPAHSDAPRPEASR